MCGNNKCIFDGDCCMSGSGLPLLISRADDDLMHGRILLRKSCLCQPSGLPVLIGSGKIKGVFLCIGEMFVEWWKNAEIEFFIIGDLACK